MSDRSMKTFLRNLIVLIFYKEIITVTDERLAHAHDFSKPVFMCMRINEINYIWIFKKWLFKFNRQKLD